MIEKLMRQLLDKLVKELSLKPGGATRMPKIHVIRIVFQDQALYARTLFRGAKTCKIGKKGVFLVIRTNFGKNMTGKLRKMHAKMRI